MDIKYSIDGLDKVFDEKGNTFLALRRISWGDNGEPKLDLRKWYTGKDGIDSPGKGFSFLSEQGPHELVNVLTESGYGDTKEILTNIKDREDFLPSLVKVVGKENLGDIEINLDNVETDEDLYDPKNLDLD